MTTDKDDITDYEDDDEVIATFTTGEAVGAFSAVVRFLKPHIAVHRVGISLVGLGLLVETAFNVLMPLSLKYFIDEVIEDGDASELVQILIVLAIAGICVSLVAVLYERKDAEVTASMIADVRGRMFRRVQGLRFAYFNRTKSGEIVSRFSGDLSTIENGLIHAANGIALPFMELFAGLMLLFVLSWPLAAITLLIFPIALIGPRLLSSPAISSSYDLKRAQAAVLGIVHEQISAQSVVKAFGLQRTTRHWFRTRNLDVRGAMARSTFLTTMVERSVTIAVLFLHLIVFGIGAWLTFHGHISVGAFVAFESVFWEISYNVAHVMNYTPLMIHAASAVRHIEDVLCQPSEPLDNLKLNRLPRLENCIAFDEVHFGYDADGPLHLGALSFSIKAGSRVAVVGPSGAGKSTVLSLLLRLYEPCKGRITLDGVDIAEACVESLREQIGVVFQDTILFDTSIRDNIRLGRPEATDVEVELAARIAEIDHFIRSLPGGYETPVGERGVSLSSGQRQRIALARAVVRNPTLLLLDEVTSALDQTTEAAIMKTLRRVSFGRSMIFVTHRLSTVMDFDEILVISEGRIIQRGTHDELISSQGLYQKLWEDQTRT
jgi:ATP-binding cassette subfamily B protein